MNRFRFLAFSLCCLAAASAAAQVGPVAITTTECATIGAEGNATVVIYVSGVWTGTLQPQAAIQGQAAFNVKVTPSASGSPQSAIAANGAYIASVAGYSSFQLCGAAVESGQANVRLKAASAAPQLNVATKEWVMDQGYSTGGGSLPSGLIAISLTACPPGFSEAAALDGKFLLGTLAAHGDVGTTGGSATLTPTGTISQPTFTGTSGQATSAVSAGTPAGTNGTVSFTPAGTNGTVAFTPSGTLAWPAGVPAFTGSAGAVPAQTISWPAGVPVFSGSALATHTHTFTGTLATASATTSSPKLVTANTSSGVAEQMTAAGTNAAISAGTPAGTVAWPAGVPTNGTVAFTPAGTIAWPVGVPTLSGSSGTVPAQTFTGSSGTVPAQTFTGSALGTHTHTLTPAGTVSQPTFTGNALNPAPPYLKVIFCQAN